MENKALLEKEPEWVREITAEWIAMQRKVCDSGILDSLMKLEQEAYSHHIGGNVCGMDVAEFERLILSAAACAEVLTHSLDALEVMLAENERLTAERDAAILYVHKDCNSCKWNYGTKPNHIWNACINCGNEERCNWELYAPCAENAPTGAESDGAE